MHPRVPEGRTCAVLDGQRRRQNVGDSILTFDPQLWQHVRSQTVDGLLLLPLRRIPVPFHSLSHLILIMFLSNFCFFSFAFHS